MYRYEWIGYQPHPTDTIVIVYADCGIYWFTDIQQCISEAREVLKTLSWPDCFGCQLIIKVSDESQDEETCECKT